jgi:hypothetical protein
MRGVSTTVLAVAATITATGNGSAVDVGDYHGLAKIVLNSGATNAGTDTVKIQDSADGSTGWADVTGWAFTAVGTTASAQELLVNVDKCKRYLRVVDTLVTATSVTRGVTLVGKKQYV